MHLIHFMAGFGLIKYTVSDIILSLTVGKNKNRCKQYGYWVTAIFAVVTNYSNLFFSLTFFLNCSHFTFGYELKICSETAGIMKGICDHLPFV